MAIHYTVDSATAHVRIVATGEVTMSGMIAMMEQVADDPRFHPNHTVVLDLRDAHYEAELKDGEALATVLKRRETRFQNRFAVVVNPTLHLLAKLYCLLCNMAGFDHIQCFTDLAAARAWCRSKD